jgi:hypothetical protein
MAINQMISSASAQIEASMSLFIHNVKASLSIVAGGDHLKTTIIKEGKPTVVPNYAKVCRKLMRDEQILSQVV